MARDVRSAYNTWVRQYDSNDNATRDLNAAVLRRQGFDLAGEAVLEIGCGTGLNTVWLAARARRVVAVDFAEGMLRAARRRLGSDVRLVQADVTRPWPFRRGFDLVVANLVLEHIRDLGHVFSEAAAVLRPGGRLYLGELHPYKQLAGSQARYRDPRTEREVLVPAYRHSVSEYTNGGLEAGFRLRRMDEWPDDRGELRLLTLLFELPRGDTVTPPRPSFALRSLP